MSGEVVEMCGEECCLYRLTSPSGKKYYGITCNFQRRMKEHSDSRGTYLANAIKSHGWDSFVKEVVHVGTVSAMKQFEISYISADNTLSPNGYNLTLGGDGISGYKHTESAKQTLSEKRGEDLRLQAGAAGKRAFELKRGVHNYEVRSLAGKKSKAMSAGVHGASSSQLSEWAKLGAVEGGKKVGKEAAKRLNSKVWECSCGYSGNPGCLGRHVKANVGHLVVKKFDRKPAPDNVGETHRGVYE